ncbi:MAG TPA: transcriptional regulator [Bacillota bacterium]|nr:transcriptional regulator [Bacillota bacterium]
MVTHQKDTITNHIINRFAQTIEMFDLAPLEARLFAYLFLNDKPTTLDEMAQAVGKSKTSMSTNIRTLLERNLVSRVWKKGVRKDLYQVNTPLFKIFMNAYIKKCLDTTSHHLLSLEKLKEKHYQDTDVEKLNEIIKFHKQLEKTFEQINQTND